VAAVPTGTGACPAVAFVLEQHLGHQTYAANLRVGVERRSDVRAMWIDVAYEPTTHWWERIPSEQVRAMLRGRTEVDTALAGVDADVCVFNTQVPAVIGGRVARSRPYVLCSDVTPRQYDAMAAGYGHRPDRPGPVGWTKDRWNRRVMRRAAAHAPWSSWVRDSLVADYGVDPDLIHVIPPGIDVAAWSPAPHDGRGPLRILFVGGEFVRKGGDVLLAAIEALGGDVEATVVTRSDIPRHPQVTAVHGLNSNDARLRELFATSDVFVLPSRSETFGIAALEAAAAGLPVVASAVGGLADLVVDGVTGLTVPPGDAAALTAALRRLAEDHALRRRMGVAGRERAEREFDATTNAGRLVDLAVRSARLSAVANG
jgi:glycosyltransferase involved in cell wall biosynthesis